jgi:hypothetical protein
VSAQQSRNAPGPILRASIEPQSVIVGQKATVRIEIMAPNYMTSPPVMPDLQIHNAITRPPSARNLSEQHDGMTFAGIVFDIAIYPLEPGSYRIANRSVSVTYAADPPTTRNVILAMPELSFSASIPEQARQLDPFVSATTLSIRQDIQQSSQPLKSGGSVARVVTVQAEGTPAMLLKPTRLAPVQGTRLYLDQPRLDDKSDGRTAVLSATRTDRATYMIERAGDITLPAIEVAWWDVKRQAIATARVQPVTLHVADSPAAHQLNAGNAASALRRAVLYLLDHWVLLLMAAIATAGAAWLLPSLAHVARATIRHRLAAYRASEAWAFKALRRTSRRGDAGDTYAAFLQWLRRFEPVAPQYTVSAFRAAAHDARLDREIVLIERRLYAASRPLSVWLPRVFVSRVAAARRRLRWTEASTARNVSLPPTINPGSGSGHEPRPNRQREKAA